MKITDKCTFSEGWLQNLGTAPAWSGRNQIKEILMYWDKDNIFSKYTLSTLQQILTSNFQPLFNNASSPLAPPMAV
jgi:hypothetical protein